MEDVKNFETLSNVVGKKATILIYDGLGFPLVVYVTIKAVYIRDYAQYRNLLHVTFVQKGKRKESVIRIYPHTCIGIYAEHVQLNDNAHKKVVSETDDVTVTSYGVCYDPNTFAAVAETAPTKPIFFQTR